MFKKILGNNYSNGSFLLDFWSIKDINAEFELFEIVSWGEDGVVYEKELYLKGCIGFDGCAHLEFGEDGYIHMCGIHSADRHSQMMIDLFNIAEKVIKEYHNE